MKQVSQKCRKISRSQVSNFLKRDSVTGGSFRYLRIDINHCNFWRIISDFYDFPFGVLMSII